MTGKQVKTRRQTDASDCRNRKRTSAVCAKRNGNPANHSKDKADWLKESMRIDTSKNPLDELKEFED